MVFSGCIGAPADHCGANGGKQITNVNSSPQIAEKPFISFKNNRYYLNIPHVE